MHDGSQLQQGCLHRGGGPAGPPAVGSQAAAAAPGCGNLPGSSCCRPPASAAAPAGPPLPAPPGSRGSVCCLAWSAVAAPLLLPVPALALPPRLPGRRASSSKPLAATPVAASSASAARCGSCPAPSSASERRNMGLSCCRIWACRAARWAGRGAPPEHQRSSAGVCLPPGWGQSQAHGARCSGAACLAGQGDQVGAGPHLGKLNALPQPVLQGRVWHSHCPRPCLCSCHSSRCSVTAARPGPCCTPGGRIPVACTGQR